MTRHDIETLVAAYFANGGTIEQCPTAIAYGAGMQQVINIRAELLNKGATKRVVAHIE